MTNQPTNPIASAADLLARHDAALPPPPPPGAPITGPDLDNLMSVARLLGREAASAWFSNGEALPGREAGKDYGRRYRRHQTMRDALTRHGRTAEFESACAANAGEVVNVAVAELTKIALGPGDITTDYGKQGQVTRTRIDRRNKIYALLRLLSARDPETWAERRRLDGKVEHAHSGQIEHKPVAGSISVPMAQLELLTDSEQAELFRLMDKLTMGEQPALPPANTNGDATDAEFRESP